MKSNIEKNSPANSLVTNKSTFNSYVEAGLWKKLEENIKFYRFNAGMVKCEVTLKSKRNTPKRTTEKLIIIEDYFK